MAKPKNKIDLAALPALSKEQLLEIAKENGIEVAAEAENEAIIKAITDYVGQKATGDEGGGAPPSDPTKDGEGEKDVVIKSVKRAGKTITAATGNPITFDKDGKATVDPKDAEYLTGIPGIEKA